MQLKREIFHENWWHDNVIKITNFLDLKHIRVPVNIITFGHENLLQSLRELHIFKYCIQNTSELVFLKNLNLHDLCSLCHLSSTSGCSYILMLTPIYCLRKASIQFYLLWRVLSEYCWKKNAERSTVSKIAFSWICLDLVFSQRFQISQSTTTVCIFRCLAMMISPKLFKIGGGWLIGRIHQLI